MFCQVEIIYPLKALKLSDDNSVGSSTRVKTFALIVHSFLPPNVQKGYYILNKLFVVVYSFNDDEVIKLIIFNERNSNNSLCGLDSPNSQFLFPADPATSSMLVWTAKTYL
jgi:hypothetical protein